MRCTNPSSSWLLICLLVLGCGESGSTDLSVAANSPPESAATARNLAWLGGMASPITSSLAVPDKEQSDELRYPGGLLLKSVADGSKLSAMGLQAGDVIVGVGDDWLPNKEDPTLDFVRLVEGQVSADQAELRLTYVRTGNCESATEAIDLAPLEQGLPLDIERYRDSVQRGLDFLTAQQLDNGSFPTPGDTLDAKLMMTAQCGMALRLGGADYRPAVDKTVEFLVSQLDEETSCSALAASYAMAFLSEAGELMKITKPMAACMKMIKEQQREDGSWPLEVSNVDESVAADSDSGQESEDAAADDDEYDIGSTYATNQVLWALGLAERNGLMGDAEVIEKGVSYLRSEAERRISANVDRRTKAGLSAGTAAAFASLGMDRSDALATRLSKESLALSEDIPLGREYAVPHFLAAGILSRQRGVNTWIDHHRHAKVLLTQSQHADGSFRFDGNEKRTDYEAKIDNECWQTAHCCLLMQLQENAAAALVAEKSHPMLVARDANGKPTEAKADGKPGLAGMQGGLQFDFDPSGMSQEELKEKLLEKLQEQGIEVDSANVQIMTSEGPPPEAPANPDD